MALCDKLKKKGRKKANKERARAEDYEAKAVQEATAGQVNARVNEEADERAAVRHLLRRRAHAFIPCGHRAICSDCSENVTTNRKLATCPMCREVYSSVVRIYG